MQDASSPEIAANGSEPTPPAVRGMTFRYVFALLLIALLSTAAFVSLRTVIATEETASTIVNISGRQRMLSQRIVMFAQRLAAIADVAQRDALRREIRAAVDLMERSHTALLSGDAAIGVPPLRSPALRAMYTNPPGSVDEGLRAFIARAREWIELPDTTLAPNHPALMHLVLDAQDRLLAPLDAAVQQHELESRQQVTRIATLETMVYMATLMVLGLAGILVFRPMVQRVRADFERIDLARREMHEAKERAEFASRSKSEFLATMSHELRTPLNSVIGFSDTIRHHVFGPLDNKTYAEYVENIYEAGRHLLDLINDVLDLSAIEAGRRDIEENVVDVVALAVDSLKLVRTRAEQGRVKLINDVPPGTPPVSADPLRLKQVLLNLLSNAVKFTPVGGEVRIGARREEDGDLLLSVSDTGIGIAPDEIAAAFEPFGQARARWTRKHEGTGLGLPLSKRLIEMHGGTLSLESAADIGTVLTIRLPAARVLSG